MNETQLLLTESESQAGGWQANTVQGWQATVASVHFIYMLISNVVATFNLHNCVDHYVNREFNLVTITFPTKMDLQLQFSCKEFFRILGCFKYMRRIISTRDDVQTKKSVTASCYEIKRRTQTKVVYLIWSSLWNHSLLF